MNNTPLQDKVTVEGRKPPVPQTGLGVWLKKNLFNSWFNTIITILSTLFVLWIGTKVFHFVFNMAEWEVISANFRLLMVGQFPVEELWRVWTVLTFISILLGLSWGIFRGTMAHIAITMGVIMAVVACLPFITGTTRIILFSNLMVIAITFFIGKKFNQMKKSVICLWVCVVPFCILLFNGIGIWEPIRTNVWGGFLLTLILASVSIVCSFPLGVLLALGRRSNLPVIKWFCIIYIEFIRGIPLLTVLFIAQLIVPLFLGSGMNLDNVLRAIIGFTLFSAAYLAENVRGGLQALPRGQFEAAKALGLNSTLMMVFIILPQALRTVIPAMVGQFISILKDTSLVAVAGGLTELLGMGKKLTSNPAFLGKQMEVYLFVAVVYFIFCFLMSHVSRRIEHSLGVGKR